VLDVVLHGSAWQLDAAAPWLPIQRRLTAPAGRRYLVGWAGESAMHVLTPRVLARRASNVEGSLEMLMLAPSALFTRRLVAAENPAFPESAGVRGFRRTLQWAWLLEGAGQYFSGQANHVRPAVARRLREGPPPKFPPGRRDAPLLGGTVFDLLAREQDESACVALARAPLDAGANALLESAFGGRRAEETEAVWRRHLARLAEPGQVIRRASRRPRRSPPRQ